MFRYIVAIENHQVECNQTSVMAKAMKYPFMSKLMKINIFTSCVRFTSYTTLSPFFVRFFDRQRNMTLEKEVISQELDISLKLCGRTPKNWAWHVPRAIMGVFMWWLGIVQQEIS